MKHKNSHLLVGYWSRLRKGRAVPDQTDIDPRAIKRMLPYVFILDAENPARPIYRLAGTALCERFGFELKGTGFLAHWEAQSGAALASLLQQALKLRQPVCLSSIGASADCGMVELETVLAPVTFGPGETDALHRHDPDPERCEPAAWPSHRLPAACRFAADPRRRTASRL